MIDLNKKETEVVSGGVKSDFDAVIVGRPRYTDKPDDYPWIRFPDPEENPSQDELTPST